MAHIVPSIDFVSRMKTSLEQGYSVQESLLIVSEALPDPFFRRMSLWYSYYRNSMEQEVQFQSQYQKNLIEILGEGLRGAPIYEHLLLLEEEMTQEFDRQWKSYLESLPMKLSIPLLLFFFPAYVSLLFGPLVIQFLTEVQ